MYNVGLDITIRIGSDSFECVKNKNKYLLL